MDRSASLFAKKLEILGAIKLGYDGSVESTEWIDTFLSAFDLGLTDLSNFSSHSSLIANPIFGTDYKNISCPDVFVLMPFDDQLKPVYDDHIKVVTEKLQLTVGRADDFFTADSIIEEVWTAIAKSRVLIADCTHRNPNVFYEIGIAHTIGKGVILIAQDMRDIPFDVRHIRSIIYEYTPRGMQDFEKKLHSTIEHEIRWPDDDLVAVCEEALRRYREKMEGKEN